MEKFFKNYKWNKGENELDALNEISRHLFHIFVTLALGFLLAGVWLARNFGP